MTPILRFTYLAVLVALVIVGMLIDLPIWGVVLLGLAATIPIAVADVVLTKRRRGRGQ